MAKKKKEPELAPEISEGYRQATEADRGFFEARGEYFTNPEWFRDRQVPITPPPAESETEKS